MKSLTRNTSTSGRIRGTVLAAAALLLPAALLAQAEDAAAQLPDITIYHSLDSLGADPRSETIPPGCTPGASAATVTIDFEDAVSGTSLENRYEGVTFSGVGDNQILALVAAGEFTGNSDPTVAAVFDSLNQLVASDDFFADFDPPVDNLRFTVVGDNAVNSAQLTVFFGTAESVIMTIPTDAIYETVHVMDLSAYADVTRIEVTSIEDSGGIGYDDFIYDSAEEAPVCVLGGADYEELKLWIAGGLTPSGGEERICSQDFDTGDGIIEGGNGDEVCGAALTFQIEGIGRFRGAIEAPVAVDPGIDTMVLGTVCSEGEGPECSFPPALKQLTLNFTTGLAFPEAKPRFLGSLIIDSTGLDPAINYSLISVFGQAAGAELQLRPIASGENPEVIADSRLLPEPGQFVQLLSGLFGLAGLNRLRRKH